jgi:hypothetical protein
MKIGFSYTVSRSPFYRMGVMRKEYGLLKSREPTIGIHVAVH